MLNTHHIAIYTGRYDTPYDPYRYRTTAGKATGGLSNTVPEGFNPIVFMILMGFLIGILGFWWWYFSE